MDMHIDDIRKELTRREFISHFDSHCPSHIGGLYDNCYKETCTACWLEAIKDIEFKDECENKESDYKIEHFSFDNDKMEVSVRLKVKSDENVKSLIEQISQWL